MSFPEDVLAARFVQGQMLKKFDRTVWKTMMYQTMPLPQIGDCKGDVGVLRFVEIKLAGK